MIKIEIEGMEDLKAFLRLTGVDPIPDEVILADIAKRKAARVELSEAISHVDQPTAEGETH